MKDKELIQKVALRAGMNEETVQQVVNAWIEEIVASLKRNESLTIRNFGRFYIREGNGGTSVFKFNPSQRLRKLFGWSSTYKGKV
ncbi:MAG: HU family DNA-binding protein [Candidatus Bipolaricaulia bacterium]